MGCCASRTENPHLSTQHVIDVDGEQLPTYNDAHFARLRSNMALSDTFLAAFKFADMKEGGGKGGNLLGFTSDKLWVVKELNDTDHNTLLALAEQYVDHVTHSDGSLLCRIVAHFHRPATNKNFMAMTNVVPPVPHPPSAVTIASESEGQAETGPEDRPRPHKRASYDLKGCADDKTLEKDGARVKEVHKRVWMVHLWCGSCCWTRERKRYYEGKQHALMVNFHVTMPQQSEVETWVKRDCAFLSDHNLMDYSLMVSCTQIPLESPEAQFHLDAHATRAPTSLPFVNVHNGHVQVLHVGIIDYLQDWTCAKTLANCIKSCEKNKATVPPNEYAARFVKYFQGKFPADADDRPADVNGPGRV